MSTNKNLLIYAMIGVFKDSSEYYSSQTSNGGSTGIVLLGEFLKGSTGNSSYNSSYQQIPQTCIYITEKISHLNHKRTLTQSIYSYHYKVTDNKYVFMCCADSECPLRICYNFLDDLETQYKRLGLNESTENMKQINNLIKDRMAYYNNVENDKISKLKNQIDSTKDVMISNIDKIIERGERLDVLVSRTEDLQDNAFNFREGSVKLKNTMKKRLIMIGIFAIIIILIVLFFIIWIGCGIPDFSRCKSSSS
ncbi:hypothetical protein ABK040_011518 [Willaertia magna]